MRLRDNPQFWLTLQKAMSLIGVLILVYHGAEGAHHGLVPDGTDALGGIVVLKEATRIWKSFSQ